MNLWYTNSMSEFQKHFIESKKPETKAFIVCNFFIKVQKQAKQICDRSQNSGYLDVRKWFLLTVMRGVTGIFCADGDILHFRLDGAYMHVLIYENSLDYTLYIIPLALKTFDRQTTWIWSLSLVDKYDSAECIQVNRGTGHRESASRLSMYSKDNTPFRAPFFTYFWNLVEMNQTTSSYYRSRAACLDWNAVRPLLNHERVSSQKLCIRHWMWNNLGQEHLQKTKAMDEQLVQISTSPVSLMPPLMCVCVCVHAHTHACE